MSHLIFEQIHTLTHAGESFAIATVTRVEKPISAKPGDKAIIQSDGALLGWVGGGCSQDIIVREAQKALRDGQPRFLRLVGSGAVAEKLDGVLEFPITCHSGGTMDVFIEPVWPRPQLILLGNSPVAVTLAQLAQTLNFEIHVYDPLATREQFPMATLLATELPTQPLPLRPLSFVVVATQGHDDESALEAAVNSRAAYIAFVASRKKFAARVEYLRERGVGAEQIARIKAPAGLDIGAITPDEIAVSILAEMIQVRRKALPALAIDKQPQVAPVVASAHDVVCGMTVEIATAKYISVYQNEKFYFCSASCKAQFEKNPAAWLPAPATVPAAT